MSEQSGGLMSYSLFQSAAVIGLAAAQANNVAATQQQIVDYLKIYFNGGTSPDGSAFAGFFTIMNRLFIGADWRLVWGPCVFCAEDNKPEQGLTNAMYVAHSQNQNAYVVAIAGSDPLAPIDGEENFDVGPTRAAAWPPRLPFVPVDHPVFPPEAPAISAGSAVGISNLLEPEEMVYEGRNLQAFLQYRVSPDSTLIFVGHSLAGALAPALAFWLYPSPQTTVWKDILILPIAGPTLGNEAFARAFMTAYPRRDALSGANNLSHFWNTVYATNVDLIPLAWDRLQTFAPVQNSKGNYPSPWGILDGQARPEAVGPTLSFLTVLLANVAGGYYFQEPRDTIDQPHDQWGQWLPTDRFPPFWEQLPTFTDEAPITCEQLLLVMRATHIDQYSRLFGVYPPPYMAKPASLSAGSQRERAARLRRMLSARARA